MNDKTNRIIKIAHTKDMSREKWLELRRMGIGGSDSSAVIGLNPWMSKLALYADKLGLMPEKQETEAMRLGRDMEAYAAKRWEEATGKKAQRFNYLIMNEKYPFGIANVDRRVVGEDAILEIKCTSPYNKSDFANGEVPPHYLVQCYHYMAICDVERCYLAVLVYGRDFYHFTIERNESEITALMNAEEDFWRDHVQAKVPPAPDGSDSAMEVLDNKFFVDDVALMPDADDLFERLEQVSEVIRDYDKQKEALKQQIIARMGNKARAQAQRWTATYLTQERTSIDRKKLLELYPQAYGDCVSTSTYRTFRTKKNKGGN